MELVGKIITIVLISLIVLTLLIGAFLIIKNENTFAQQVKIINAIYAYHIEHGYTDVYYSDMEPYESTMRRLWDWGCTRILPKEKYELIRPYIKEKK